MAKFLISPGVHIREIDQSQYAATTPTGNVAAIAGYAEKGPFEPTIVSGTQDFVQTFGKTLEDIPYLAQTAYKYFEQGSSMLVVRAGDNRDPELYPQAAQYASKTIRVGAHDVSATEGYQEFSADSDIGAGTYAPDTVFTVKVTADHRAFQSTKYLETWDAKLHWVTMNGADVSSWDSQPTGFPNAVAKIAMDQATDNNFEIDYKVIQEEQNDSGQYYGTGSRTGTDYGSDVSATVRLYQKNGDYTAGSDDDFNTITGTYQAVVIGTTDMQGGTSWTSSAEEFEVTLGATQYTVALDTDCADPDAIVSHINSQLVTAEGSSGTVDISSKLEAFYMTEGTSQDTKICLRHTDSAEDGFEIGSNPFGWVQDTYSDSEAVYGTYHSEDDGGGVYTGRFVMTFDSAESGAHSFLDPLEIEVTSPASGDWTLSDIVSQLNTGLDTGYDDYPNDPARGTASLNTETGRIRITCDFTPAGDDNYSIVRLESGSGNSLVDLLGGTQAPSDGQPSRSLGEALVTLIAAEKGSYGNKLVLRTETTTVQLSATETENRYNVYVLLDGKEVSVYQRVNWDDPTSDDYVPTLLENDAYMRMDAEDEDGNSTLERLPDADWELGNDILPDGVFSSGSAGGTGIRADIIDYTVGTNGYTMDEDGMITSMSADLTNALQKIYNPEVYDFNLVVAPGDASSIVQNAITSLCESRRDCFGIIEAAPFGLGVGIKNNLNHVAEVNDAVDNVNSSYIGAYWPWMQDYDSDNKQYLWLPPSTYALAQMVYTDNIADPWFAAAGLRRGKVTAIDVEYSPTRADRDILYGGTNIVNPIVKLVGEGIVIWGQKTGQRTKSATDRINVRRLLIYAEKLIANMARGFLFEPNDPANWSAFARQANGILEPIRQRRGLYRYQVVCDETTNTDQLVDQNIMAGQIFLQPTKAIEFVQVDFTITATGVEFNEG